MNITDDEVFDLVEGGEELDLFAQTEEIAERVVDESRTETTYYEGQKQESYIDSDGSESKRWVDHEEGKVRAVDTYDSEGKRIKRTRYYEDGTIEWEQNWGGEPVGERTIETIEYSPDGNKTSEIRKKDGEYHGTQRKYVDGELEAEENWDNGRLKGDRKIYYTKHDEGYEEHGHQLKSEATYTGQLTRGGIRYSENKPFSYRDTEMAYHKKGENKEYYPDGSVKTIRSYKDEQIEGSSKQLSVGTHYKFDDDGLITEEYEVKGHMEGHREGDIKAYGIDRDFRDGKLHRVYERTEEDEKIITYPQSNTDRQNLSAEDFNEKYKRAIKRGNIDPK
tara:strand:+ start:683 stop:1687 length:1005 start_codon:yes stop_codon:yes gene_type:complete